MKLIVIIPAYNEEATIGQVIREIPRNIEGLDKVEVLVLNDGSYDRTEEVAQKAGADYIISHKRNLGLARTFNDAIFEALKRGADIIVNTDADNHYNQSKIPELIEPILKGKADLVIANRMIRQLKFMPWPNKIGNLLGNIFVSKLLGQKQILDVSSGFRAYSREAALRINVYSRHTYTHETLIQALDHNLIVEQVFIPAREVKRKSRLIKSIPRHIVRSLIVIFRIFTLYKPLRVMLALGGFISAIGLLFVLRFLYFYFFTPRGGAGHVQSLILASVLIIVGFQIGILGLIASAVGWNRKFQEEILYRFKKREIEE